MSEEPIKFSILVLLLHRNTGGGSVVTRDTNLEEHMKFSGS